MTNAQQKGPLASGKAGFSLIEAVVASSIAVLAVGATMALFVWCSEQFATCSKLAWSQNEALHSSNQLLGYFRNASAVTGIATNGTWIRLRFPDGTVGHLAYSNSASTLRDGRLYLQRTNTTTVIVARGLTESMDGSDMFSTTPSSNIIRVAYRVSEPVAPGLQAADDERFAAIVRFSVCLRNLYAE